MLSAHVDILPATKPYKINFVGWNTGFCLRPLSHGPPQPPRPPLSILKDDRQPHAQICAKIGVLCLNHQAQNANSKYVIYSRCTLTFIHITFCVDSSQAVLEARAPQILHPIHRGVASRKKVRRPQHNMLTITNVNQGI